MTKVKFLRRNWNRHSKLGRKRKNKQVWRRPKGRHNKMREGERGYPAVVNVGYRTDKKERGRIDGKIPRVILNLKDLENLKKNEIALVGSVGTRKKMEIVKKAEEKKIALLNINPKTFVKNVEKIMKKKKMEAKK